MASVLRRLSLVVVVVWSVGYSSLVNAQVDECVEGNVRLIGGSHYREGNVEVCRNQQWGRVCDDRWDELDSAVVCSQLGLANEGVMAFTSMEPEGNPFTGNNDVPFVLDDLECNGSERNLLQCLPNANCRPTENAGVRCQRKGVTLEHGPLRLMNNSIVTLNEIGEASEALFCATDSRTCCTEDDGNWYSPNGSKIGPQTVNSPQVLYTSWDNHTIGLNYANFSDIASGIYHCKIADNNSITNHLYVGIYPQEEGIMRVTSLNYDSTINTLVCTSTGGPVTTVTWFKDNDSRINNDQYYEQSMVIVNATTATYESRLRILNKSSESTGKYTCMVSNSRGSSTQSKDLEVCRDMELRFSDQGAENVEVCIGDQWHAVTNGAIVNNNTRGNIAIIARNPTSVMIRYTNNQRIQAYDVSCTTVSDGQMQSTTVTGMSRETTELQINGLTPDTIYECCATAYMMTSVPIDIISLSCTTINTPRLDLPVPCPTISTTSQVGDGLFMIGFWTVLGICVLVLFVCVGFIIGCLVALKRQTRLTKYSIGSPEKEYSERMVLNPIYATDSGSFQGSSEFKDRHLSLSVAQNPQYGTRAEVVPVTYETISEFPTRPKAGTHSRSTNSQPGVDEPNTNGLGNTLASHQLDSVDSKTDATTPQLYSTIPESYKQQKLGSSEKTQKHPLVYNTYEDH